MPPYNRTVKRYSKDYPVMKAGPLRDCRIHREIAAVMLKRPLRKDEDGNKLNFRWTNLIVLGNAIHGAVSARQHWYLKQRYSREDAAWKAYFDVTGETYDGSSMEVSSLQTSGSEVGFGDTSFMPELLGGTGLDEAVAGD